MQELIFVSSVQKELQAERYAIRDYINSNYLLRQFFSVYLFEDLPPADRQADEIFLNDVVRSPIYVGIFGNEYGGENEEGLSPTEREFNYAGENHKRRLIFIKGRHDDNRQPKMKALILRAGEEIVRRRFENTEELLQLLYASLIQYLQDRGFIFTRGFDEVPCSGATLNDISIRKLKWFIAKAREERGYVLSVETPSKKALTHLKMLTGDKPTRGAILLFSEAPERYIYSADLTCLHFHSTKIGKPIRSQQIYHGTLFEQVDQSLDFVMARLTRSVEPSDISPESNVKYEVPYRVVREAIVNAVAHRDYASKSGIQVMVFTDRIEVWNPGGLLEDLTVEKLRKPHASIRRNELICEPLYLTRYIERAGTGTLDMIKLCSEAGLPEPEFLDEGERFITVLWRDWLTEDVLNKLGITDRQLEGVQHVKKTGKITNSEYRELVEVTQKTAARDLDKLVEKGIFERVGAKRGTYYVLATKR